MLEVEKNVQGGIQGLKYGNIMAYNTATEVLCTAVQGFQLVCKALGFPENYVITFTRKIILSSRQALSGGNSEGFWCNSNH